MGITRSKGIVVTFLTNHHFERYNCWSPCYHGASILHWCFNPSIIIPCRMENRKNINVPLNVCTCMGDMHILYHMVILVVPIFLVKPLTLQFLKPHETTYSGSNSMTHHDAELQPASGPVAPLGAPATVASPPPRTKK